MTHPNTLLGRYLGYDKFGAPDCTVILIDSGYLAVSECARGLESLGHRIHRIAPGPDFVKRLLTLAVQVKPDFLLTVNHLGFDEEGKLTRLLDELGMPFASWYVDSPSYVLKGGAGNVSAGCLVFCWERSWMGALEEMGFAAPVYLPLATDPEIFRPGRFNGAGSDAVPLSFVGSSLVKDTARRREALASPPDERLRRAAVGRQLADRRVPMRQILAGLGEGGDDLDLEAALVWEATQTYRQGLLRALLPLGLVVYGDDGWRELLASAAHLLPPVDYFRQLPGVFNETSVNVNATSMQMNSTVNQRVFDAAACGAFMLTDRTLDMERFFDEGTESVCYGSPEEAHDLASYYLARKGERDAVAAAARRRVLAEHTYGRRMKVVVDTMRERYA